LVWRSWGAPFGREGVSVLIGLLVLQNLCRVPEITYRVGKDWKYPRDKTIRNKKNNKENYLWGDVIVFVS